MARHPQEGFDYGSIPVARVVLNLEALPAGETLLDLNRMGASLSVDLREMLEQLHAEKPTDGYHPIAWHNVWWNIISKYEGLSFMLETREAFAGCGHGWKSTHQQAPTGARPQGEGTSWEGFRQDASAKASDDTTRA